MSQGIALTIGSALVALTAISLWSRLRSLTLADLFLLSLAMFYGAYTVMDALLVPMDGYDPFAVSYVLVSACAAAFLVWGYGRVGPRSVLHEVSLSRLTEDWSKCNGMVLIVALGPAVIYAWYTATYFADIDVSNFEKFMAIESELPYWYTTLGMISMSLLWAITPVLFWKAVEAKSFRRLMWLAIAAAGFILVFGHGRRAILMVIITAALATAGRMKRGQLASLAVVAVLIPGFFLLSNLFQAYRLLAYRGVPVTSVLEGGDLIEKAVDVQQTLSNLQQREAMWRLNYELVDADSGSHQWGRLLLVSVPNYIPKVVWPGKEVIDPETEMLEAFHLPVDDRPNSLLSYAYADFGHLAIVVAPAIMIFFTLCYSLVLRRLRDPFLRSVLMGFAISYALHMETDYVAGLLVFRDFAFVAVAYIAAVGLLRVARSALAAGLRSGPGSLGT